VYALQLHITGVDAQQDEIWERAKSTLDDLRWYVNGRRWNQEV